MGMFNGNAVCRLSVEAADHLLNKCSGLAEVRASTMGNHERSGLLTQEELIGKLQQFCRIQASEITFLVAFRKKSLQLKSVKPIRDLAF